ncbi:MAG: ferritin-like domain-containing protein [bacterium]|nr:ferritin-like domain-containing protein [bacterium]
MKLNSLRDLLIDNLKDLHSAETQITKALPKMAKAASSPQLKQAFELHREQTQQQVERLEQILTQMGASKAGKKCKGMEGLIEEASELLEEEGEPSVIDAGLIGAAQKVEHYEIAGYGTAIAHAQQLGELNVAGVLQQTLAEEEQTDAKLTSLAESMINNQASQGE